MATNIIKPNMNKSQDNSSDKQWATTKTKRILRDFDFQIKINLRGFKVKINKAG